MCNAECCQPAIASETIPKPIVMANAERRHSFWLDAAYEKFHGKLYDATPLCISRTRVIVSHTRSNMAEVLTLTIMWETDIRDRQLDLTFLLRWHCLSTRLLPSRDTEPGGHELTNFLVAVLDLVLRSPQYQEQLIGQTFLVEIRLQAAKLG
jgi:hypothetical protein